MTCHAHGISGWQPTTEFCGAKNVPMQKPVILLLFLCACGGHDSSDTGASGGNVPDVEGTYNVMINGATGCEGEYSVLTDWAQGFLGITAASQTELVFEFRDGISFSGSVDATWSYSFGGTATWGEATLYVYNSGMFYQEDDIMKMSGDFEVEVDDDEFTSNNCILDATMEATQIAR